MQKKMFICENYIHTKTIINIGHHSMDGGRQSHMQKKNVYL